PIASFLGERLLARRGVACDSLALNISWDLSRVAVGPTTCRLEHGRVAELGLPSGGEVRLAWLRPRALDADVLRVVPRELPEDIEFAGPGMLGDELARAPMERGFSVAAGFAERVDRIDLRVGRLELVRDERGLVVTDVVVRRTDEGLYLEVEKIEPRGGALRRGPVEVHWHVGSLVGRVAPHDVDVRGRLRLDATLAGLGRRGDLGFAVRGRDLNGLNPPNLTISWEDTAEIRSLRDIAQRLRDALR
ncbi:MAG: hypothetical protein R3B99_26740, partial [Polyangiales bacterium]